MACKFARFWWKSGQVPGCRRSWEPCSGIAGDAGPGRVLALSQATLQRLLKREWFAGLLAETPFTLVYGFAAAEGESAELKFLTGEALKSVVAPALGPKQVEVRSEYCRLEISRFGQGLHP